MNFKSKDAPLKESIAKMQAVLADINCNTAFSQEKHPLKHCYSVNLASEAAPNHIYANGKGSESEASIASALGEFIERVQTNNFVSDFFLPERHHYPDQKSFVFDRGYLDPELRQFYDPDGQLVLEDLVDFNSDTLDKIIGLPFSNQMTGKTTYFPINILNNLYVSNGLATGNSPLEAKVQALSEILERYAKIAIIKNGYALPPIPAGIIEACPKLQRDIASLRESGYIIEILDASLGGRFPVTAISLINPQNSTLYVSFGAHPILEVALERTMTELMQGRDMDHLDVFEVPTFDMDFVADSFNLESHFIDSNGKVGFPFLAQKKSFPYTPCPYQGQGCADEYRFLTDIIKNLDKEIYLREYTYLGFYSCHMVVPGVSEVYPIEDLTFNNRNQGKWIRDMVLNFQEYRPEDILKAVDDLDDTIQLGHYIGVIFKHPFSMLEFKAHLHLILGNKEDALTILEFSAEKIGMVIVELLRMEVAQLEWQEYGHALFAVFGKNIVIKAKHIIDNKEFLVDTTPHSDYQNMLALYDNVYAKKQPAPQHGSK